MSRRDSGEKQAGGSFVSRRDSGENSRASQIKKRRSFSVREMTFGALGCVLITVCAQISVPSAVPFTLQTFAVFCCLSVLGGKCGTLSVALYLAMGGIGLPVFSNMTGGVGKLFGLTGGYLFGMLFTALLYWAITAKRGSSLPVTVISMLLGLAAVYACGTAWFYLIYTNQTGHVGLFSVISWCVLPFILPDLVKLAFACTVGAILKKRIGNPLFHT